MASAHQRIARGRSSRQSWYFGYELAYRRPNSESAEARKKRVQVGYRSQEKLIDLIEARDGAAAEAHWIRHMKAAGDVWLHGISKTSVIDILD